MAKYWVNDNRQTGSGNNNEVHKEGCYWLPLIKEKTYLGDFASCHGAVAEAQNKYPTTADGCATCSSECNQG